MENLLRGLKLGSSAIALVASAQLAATAAAAQGTAPMSLPTEEIVVTGSSIRGVAPVGSNLVTVDQAQIERTGAVSIQELMNTVTAISTSGAAPQGENSTGYYAVQIHQLAASASNSTLVIVDGLRLPGGGQQGYEQIDPNVIPTAALERVEVLADGASSIYGSDAVAGVVNFITRKRYDGAEFHAEGGIADQYHNEDIGFLWGSNWDRGSVMVAGGYTFQSRLAKSARSLLSIGDYTSYGGNKLNETFGCPVAAFSTPQSSSGLYLSPQSTTTVANTIANRNCNPAIYGDALPQSIRERGLMKLTQDFSDKFSITTMFVMGDLKTNSRAAPGTISNVTVYGPGSGKGGQINPFFQAPAGQLSATQESVTWVDLLGNGSNNLDFGTSTTEENTMYASFVATYKVAGDWEVRLSEAPSWNHNQSASIEAFCATCAYLALNGTGTTSGSTTTSVVAGQNIINLNTPLTTANSLDVWNPVGSSNKTSAATLLNLYRGQTGVDDVNTQNQMKLEASGSLFDLPAGAVKGAVGGEWLNLHLVHSLISADGVTTNINGLKDLLLHYSRVVYSAYAEMNIPVVSPDMNLPFMRKIDVDISARYDKYNDVGVTSNPKYAMNWEVVEGFRLRANYSTSFVAPPLGVLGDPAYGGMKSNSATVQAGGITIPVAAYPSVTQLPGCAGQTVSCTLASSVQGLFRAYGGLLDNIKPQTGDGWSIGADIAPMALPGFTANITLFNNQFKGGNTQPTITNITSSASLNHLLTLCPTGCSQGQIDDFLRVNQGAIFSGNVPTTVYFLENTDQQNILYLNIQGIDLSASYQFATDIGVFKIGEELTQFLEYEETNGKGGVFFNVLNTSGLNPTFPSIATKNRMNVGWSDDAVAVDVFVNYTGSYRFAGNTAVGAISLDSIGNYAGGGDVVKANVTVDAHVSYNFPDGMFAGDQIYFDVKNLFDQDPPFVNTGNGYNVFNANPIGRLVSLGLQAKF